MPLSANSPLYAVIADIVNAAKGPDAFDRVKAVLREHTDRFHASGVLAHEEEDDEVLLHASPNLTIYHITLSPGLQYPAHNHLMDALIGIYKGSETNFIYPVDGSEIDTPERQDIAAPTVLHMTADTVHAVANTGSARSGALHVYLGDLTEIDRHMWSPDSNQAEPFDNERYLAGARPIG
ncbi:autotransporter [Mesorhizobium caraganae]|uniref:autotransporter n=1 Tax=Mesorhizobium caraganae TaxID=483206 RepID=UPI001780CED5|nr:autotransporter [Mesorhizobium caraganae]MBM2710391.1 autotransporter [Mesorhizobium caraganae]